MVVVDFVIVGYLVYDECVGRCRDGIVGLCFFFVIRYVYSKLINE